MNSFNRDDGVENDRHVRVEDCQIGIASLIASTIKSTLFRGELDVEVVEHVDFKKLQARLGFPNSQKLPSNHGRALKKRRLGDKRPSKRPKYAQATTTTSAVPHAPQLRNSISDLEEEQVMEQDLKEYLQQDLADAERQRLIDDFNQFLDVNTKVSDPAAVNTKVSDSAAVKTKVSDPAAVNTKVSDPAAAPSKPVVETTGGNSRGNTPPVFGSAEFFRNQEQKLSQNKVDPPKPNADGELYIFLSSFDAGITSFEITPEYRATLKKVCHARRLKDKGEIDVFVRPNGSAIYTITRPADAVSEAQPQTTNHLRPPPQTTQTTSDNSAAAAA